jgi:hypothetical protein
MLASRPPLERNASEWLVGSPIFQALNVYDLQDLAEGFLDKSAWIRTRRAVKYDPEQRSVVDVTPYHRAEPVLRLVPAIAAEPRDNTE